MAGRLLAWYRREGRALPWRSAEALADPYRLWLAEIMLQQTTVATVIPYYRRFLARWPDIEALAAAPRDAVLHAWAGLGYYARARNLHDCARRLVAERGGCFPGTERELRALPGIGPYSAAAIAAIAFGEPACVVDGNVERVMARLHAISEPLPGARGQLRDAARALTPRHRAGDYAQAIMDLGATVCTPRNARCARCPWRADCRALAQGMVEELPARTPKPRKPTRRGTVYWAERRNGAGREILLHRRPEGGLLGAMMEFPSQGWNGKVEAPGGPPFEADWQPVGSVRHSFTHFHLELAVERASVGPDEITGGRWCPLDQLNQQPLPTVMKKVARLVLKQEIGDSV